MLVVVLVVCGSDGGQIVVCDGQPVDGEVVDGRERRVGEFVDGNVVDGRKRSTSKLVNRQIVHRRQRVSR